MEINPSGLTKTHLRRANIGEDFWEIDFSTYNGPSNAKTLAYRYLLKLKTYQTRGIGMTFAGKPGTGKTSLMAIVLKYLARANWTAYMISLSELIEEIKRAWETNDRDIIDKCKNVAFLGLDDVGKEHLGPTGFSSTTFDNLLRFRAQTRRPILVTTNLNSNQIADRYGRPVLSLIEGKTQIIEVNGQDYRTSVLKHELP